MLAMIFSNFWKLRHARESSSNYYYYYYYTSRLERLQPCRNEISPSLRVSCHSINGPGISGPGGPFMLDIVGPPGPLMPKHKWSARTMMQNDHY